MSVTLGELTSGIPLTLHPRPQQILNNMGQDVTPPAARFSKLQKRDYTKQSGNHDESAELPPVHAQQPGEGVPYTLIDNTPILNPQLPPPQPGALFGDQNQALQFNPYQAHNARIDDLMPYSAMGPYNSNRINQDFQYIVGPTPAGQALRQAQQGNVWMDPSGVQYAMGRDGKGMTLPRPISFEEAANMQKAPMIQYGQFNPYPEIAGGVPRLMNAVASDQSVAMGDPLRSRFGQTEGFAHSGHGGQPMSCREALHHVMTCPVCSKYVQCSDNKMYVVMMLLLIVIFSILLYMAMKNNNN